MPKPPKVRTGVPIRRLVKVKGNVTHTNFYLMRMEVVDETKKDKLAFKSIYHLFTAKELVEATDRYYRHMDCVINRGLDVMLGYTYPITYNNQNGYMTTRWFVKFDGSKVEDMDRQIYCGLFSAREMRRSRDRMAYMICQGDSFFSRIIKRIRQWLTHPEET